jgi:hypothetical protein
MRIQIRTGGQSGVDRAALKVAVERQLPYGGWCPRGGWAEDRPSPPGIRNDYPQLIETPSAVPQQRTAWNVRDSHLTLILYRGDAGDWRTGNSPQLETGSIGTWFTLQCALFVFERPCLIVKPDEAAVGTVVDWLKQVSRSLHLEGLILNVAGPRENQDPGIEQVAHKFLSTVLQKVVD